MIGRVGFFIRKNIYTYVSIESLLTFSSTVSQMQRPELPWADAHKVLEVFLGFRAMQRLIYGSDNTLVINVLVHHGKLESHIELFRSYSDETFRCLHLSAP